MYQACIFDLDGTLANTLYSISAYSNAALKQRGYAAIADEDYRRIVGDGADTQMHRMLDRVCGHGNYTEDDIAALRRVYDRLYAGDPMHLVRDYSGMKETVSALKQAGIRTAVLSNKPDDWAKAIVAALYPAGSFDLCYGQRPSVPRKPSPEGALLIAKELEVSPERCLYIGDTNTDMKTGRAAGMDTAGALWGFRDRRELEENYAVYILESPEKILSLFPEMNNLNR